jgi:hypothetical protein
VGRARGYSTKTDKEECDPPPDPAAEQRRAIAMRVLHEEIERRARAGQPPLFAQPPQAITVQQKKPGAAPRHEWPR